LPRSASTTSYVFHPCSVKSHSLLYRPKKYAFSTKCFKPIGVRTYSTSKSDDFSTDLAVFSDADKDKLEILFNIKGKSGVYMWINKINGKKYVGSSVNLRRRITEYYNINNLLRRKGENMLIHRALLKYSYSNFRFEILEFCERDHVISQEKYYSSAFSPEYNLQTPGDTDKGWNHSKETIGRMRRAALESWSSPEIIMKRSLAQVHGLKVEVTDVTTGVKSSYHAIRAAARALGIDRRYIENYIYLKQEVPVSDRYTFKLLGVKDISSNTEIELDKNNIRKQSSALKLEVLNVENSVKTIYSSVTSAAKDLGIRQTSISLYLKDKRTKPFKGKYIFKLV
jgi:hypothetical protein